MSIEKERKRDRERRKKSSNVIGMNREYMVRRVKWERKNKKHHVRGGGNKNEAREINTREKRFKWTKNAFFF